MAKNNLFDNAKFSFIGTLGHGNEPMSTVKMGDSKWYKDRLAVSIRNEQNSPYLTMEHIHENATETGSIRLLGKEKDEKGKTQWITVDVSETEKEEVLNKVADFTKVTIDLETNFEKKKEYTSLIFKKRNHEIENNKLLAQESLTDEEKKKIEDNNSKIEEYSKQIKEMATNRKDFIMKDAIKFLNTALPLIETLLISGTTNINL